MAATSAKSSLAKVFTWRSRLATFVFFAPVFIAARVSPPVYTTSATAVPDASTELAHSAFSSDKASTVAPPSAASSYSVRSPPSS